MTRVMGAGVDMLAHSDEIPAGMDFVAIPFGIGCYTDEGSGILLGPEHTLFAEPSPQFTIHSAFHSGQLIQNIFALRSGPGLDEDLACHPELCGNVLIPGLYGVPDPLLLCDGTPETCPTTLEQREQGRMHQCTGILGYCTPTDVLTLAWGASFSRAERAPLTLMTQRVELSEVPAPELLTYEWVTWFRQFSNDPASLADSELTQEFKKYCWKYWYAWTEGRGEHLAYPFSDFCSLAFSGEGGISQLMLASDQVMCGIYDSFFREFETHVKKFQDSSLRNIDRLQREERWETAESHAMKLLSRRIELDPPGSENGADLFTPENHAWLSQFSGSPSSLADNSPMARIFKAYCWDYWEAFLEQEGGEHPHTTRKYFMQVPLMGGEHTVAGIMVANDEVISGIYDSFLREFAEHVKRSQYKSDQAVRNRETVKSRVTRDSVSSQVAYCRSIIEGTAELELLKSLLNPLVFPHVREALTKNFTADVIEMRDKKQQKTQDWIKYCTGKKITSKQYNLLKTLFHPSMENMMSMVAFLVHLKIDAGQRRKLTEALGG
ncbi:hypothetical protein [Streptomyces sp. NPDC057910]|uniref:hypothetical protein n=1 Tax=Streptomyces sp. NPDC057910 TaxID=3346278 RepID=UPI0036E7A965